MTSADTLHDAEQQALGRLAEMDLSLAERLHALAMTAGAPKDIIEFTRAYQRAGRCVRQSIMLKARLRQKRERLLAEASPGLPRHEREDAIDRIDAWIDREARKGDDFGRQDLDEHVLELCRACDLDLPEDLGRRFRDLPRAPWDAVDGAYAFDPPAAPAAEPGRRDTG